MPFEYVPESGRKKFKPGQPVWYIDHIDFEIKTGLFTKYCEYDRECEDTVCIKCEYSDPQVLEDWVFTDEKNAIKELKKVIKAELTSLKIKQNHLKKKLESLKNT